MTLYTTIEEKFCISAKKNVAIEVTHHNNGTISRKCLSQACENPNTFDCRLIKTSK